jgi:hypothetical protein
MAGRLPTVARSSTVRRRLLLRRAVTLSLLVIVGWLALTVGLGAVAQEGFGCTACHAMAPYAEAAASSSHPTVGCAGCHRASGPTSLLQDGLAMQRRAIKASLGTTPTPADVDESRCMDCHAQIRSGVRVSRGIRVRHSDFLDQRCGECHGATGHPIAERHYAVPEMDRCLGCHAISAGAISACALCHSTDSQRQRRETDTSWRVTHGPNWKKTHGAGDLATCSACHDAAYCVRCHYTPIPHVVDWEVLHGRGLPDDIRKTCADCHEPVWCTTCHGVEMPHPEGFLPTHGEAADRFGEPACSRCHSAAECEDCHLRSSHPDLPGVGMDVGATQ